MRMQARKNRHATRKRTRGRKKRDFQAAAQSSGIQQVGFSQTARAFLRLCRTGSFIVRKRLFQHHRKGSPAHPKRLFRTRKKCPPRAGSEKDANFPPHYAYTTYAQAFFRSGGISSSFPLFPPTHCNTSCINIHKEPPQQAACHLPTSAPARRRPPSADTLEA